MNKKPVCCPCGEKINLFAVSTANALSCGLSTEEVDVLSSIFSLIGDALGVIVASRTVCETLQDNAAQVNTTQENAAKGNTVFEQ